MGRTESAIVIRPRAPLACPVRVSILTTFEASDHWAVVGEILVPSGQLSAHLVWVYAPSERLAVRAAPTEASPLLDVRIAYPRRGAAST